MNLCGLLLWPNILLNAPNGFRLKFSDMVLNLVLFSGQAWDAPTFVTTFVFVFLYFLFFFLFCFFKHAVFSMWVEVDLIEKGWGRNVSQRTFECSVKFLRIFLFCFVFSLFFTNITVVVTHYRLLATQTYTSHQERACGHLVQTHPVETGRK